VVASASAGASNYVPLVEEANLAAACRRLKDVGFWIYGADMGGKPLWEADLKGRVALVFGGEAGLSRLLAETCDSLLSIPTQGRIDSLNVSVAAGIFLYETTRQNRAH
jgi:23S rRNA (guanosine2251-2'-O)-methyltransferase